MKRIILSLSLVAFLFSFGNSQNDLTLTINHFLGDEVFAMNEVATTELDHDFKVERLQYYISKISVLHDGGQETSFDDVYALITNGAATSSAITLGNHDISSVEKLTFHIGVDEETNHLDPAIYAAQHPLAPKNPSMHWGWAAGYRFIAFEGKCGAAIEESLQFHCIGDNNYTQVEFEIESIADAGVLDIQIDADYVQALSTIDISSGLVQHGDIGPNVTLAENFGDKVFSPSSTSVNAQETEVNVSMNVYPNPSNGENIKLELDLDNVEATIEVTDIAGKKILSQNALNGLNVLSIDGAGIYMVNVISKTGYILATSKLIVE